MFWNWTITHDYFLMGTINLMTSIFVLCWIIYLSTFWLQTLLRFQIYLHFLHHSFPSWWTLSTNALVVSLQCTISNISLTRRMEIPSCKMPYRKKWKMWRLHSKSYLRARSHPMGFSMSTAIWCLTLKWRISRERHA